LEIAKGYSPPFNIKVFATYTGKDF
jgi:hypothetical protein